MEISTKELKRVVIVKINGRVDSTAALEFESALKELSEAGRNTLILDMKGVEFLASAGLRVMVTAKKVLEEVGGDLIIAQPSQRVTDTLDIAGLDVLFTMYPDRETAIGSY